MANKVTQDNIKEFNALYYETKNYSEVARRTGFSASTVRKYVDKNWKPIDTTDIIRFTGEVPDINFNMFRGLENYGELCQFSDEEFEEIKLLWKELEI